MTRHHHINLILLRNEVGKELTRFCIRIDGNLIAVVSHTVLVLLAYVRALEVIERSAARRCCHLIGFVLICKLDAYVVGEIVLRE